jgi:hypothetical protein
MNVGDELEIRIEEFVVGTAVVREISDGKAYVIVPAMEVTFGVKNVLTDLEEEAPEVDRVLVDEPPKYRPPKIKTEETGVQEKPVPRENDDIGEGMQSMKLDSSALDD